MQPELQGAAGSFTQVITTAGFMTPTQWALRGGLMKGVDWISFAPLTQ